MKKKIFLALVFCILYLVGTESEASLPYPYDSIELLPFDPQGWYGNGAPIEMLFAIYKPKVVIEVGCWAGASTRHMASLLSEGGVVYAVDHWKGSIEHQPGQGWWSPILPKLYEQFLSNVIHAQLTDKIIPVRMSSLEASKHLAHISADLIYIDASHDYQSVYDDLNAWYPLLKEGGILSGDDWGYPDICKAVYQFAEEKGLEVKAPEARLWYLIK